MKQSRRKFPILNYDDPPARKGLKLDTKRSRPTKTTSKQRVNKRAKHIHDDSKSHDTADNLRVTSRIGFLDLPAEMRNEVYAYAVPSNKDNRMKSSLCAVQPDLSAPWYFTHGQRDAPQLPAISKTNDQMRNEILPMFYARNDFHVHSGLKMDLSQAATWLMRLGPSIARFIRRIHVVCAPLRWQYIANVTPFLDAVRVLGLKRTQIVVSPHVGLKENALDTLRDFFDLAHKAQDESWSEQGLEDQVARWIEVHIGKGKRAHTTIQFRDLQEGPAEVSEARKSGRFGLRARSAVKYSA